MPQPMLIANWKMHKTLDEATAFMVLLRERLTRTDRGVVVCPPALYLDSLRRIIKGTPIGLGAQTIHFEEKGAFTGEISAAMLAAMGIGYTIIGHSERRQYFAETDETVNKKTRTALSKGLVPIVCVGETKAERDANKAFEIVDKQIKFGLGALTLTGPDALVVAYEPVWAIGTGVNATPEDAEEMHRHIRGLLAELFGQTIADGICILYGGSVKSSNIAELMAKPDINGALIGGASLDIEEYLKIINY